MNHNKEYLTYKQAASFLGCQINTLYSLQSKGKITVVSTLVGKRLEKSQLLADLNFAPIKGLREANETAQAICSESNSLQQASQG